MPLEKLILLLSELKIIRIKINVWYRVVWSQGMMCSIALDSASTAGCFASTKRLGVLKPKLHLLKHLRGVLHNKLDGACKGIGDDKSTRNCVCRGVA
jgi:hypothetical protein